MPWRLTESAIMIAAATILSMFKLVELPYGGSITLASMLPIVIIAYRYGTAWGILCGLVHGAIQLLLGSGTLSYVTGAASVVAVILLDYIVAFAVCGLAGIFRNIKKQSTGLLCGAVLVSVLRYACHVVSGFTVWRDISVPAADAVIYSFIYNATYMLPEMIVLRAQRVLHRLVARLPSAETRSDKERERRGKHKEPRTRGDHGCGCARRCRV